MRTNHRAMMAATLVTLILIVPTVIMLPKMKQNYDERMAERMSPGKYSVCVGDAAIALCYDTDSWTDNGDTITFVKKKNGKTVWVPREHLHSIEEN